MQAGRGFPNLSELLESFVLAASRLAGILLVVLLFVMVREMLSHGSNSDSSDALAH